jgi:transposase
LDLRFARPTTASRRNSPSPHLASTHLFSPPLPESAGAACAQICEPHHRAISTSLTAGQERVKRLDEAQVSGFGFAPDVTLAMQANLAVMQTLQEEIGIIEKRLMERVKLHQDYALLNSVPGIGPILATTIMLETGSISRFAEVGNFRGFCRINAVK